MTPTYAAQGSELALADALSRAQDLLRQSLAQNTCRAYAADWRDFSSWCQAHHRVDLPALLLTATLSATDRDFCQIQCD